MRASELVVRGFSPHMLSKELSLGKVERPQRGWIALPDADPQLVFAARRGVILSCVTMARRLGLWVLQDTHLHLATRTSSAKIEVGQNRLHWGRPVRRREPFLLEDPIENVLGYVAVCQPAEEALAIWESALNKGLVTRSYLERFDYAGRAREMLDAATPFSDSGLESYVGRRLRSLGLRVVAQAWVLGHRVDFLIEGWVVLQIDGAQHAGRQRDQDNRHDSLLMRNGYFPIRGSYWEVMDRWPEIQREVMEAVSLGPRILLGSQQRSGLSRIESRATVRLSPDLSLESRE